MITDVKKIFTQWWKSNDTNTFTFVKIAGLNLKVGVAESKTFSLLVRPLRRSTTYTDKVNTWGLDPFIGVLPESFGNLDSTLPELDSEKTSGLGVFGVETDYLLSLWNPEDFKYSQVSVTDYWKGFRLINKKELRLTGTI